MSGAEPVAMTKRRARINKSAAATVCEFDKARRAFDHLYAESGEPRARDVRRQCADDVLYLRIQRREIDPGAAGFQPEAREMPRRIGAFGRGNERLRRHAAAVEADATQAAFFDKHDRHVEGGRRGRHRKPAWPRANDADFGFQFFAVLRHQPADRSALTAFPEACLRGNFGIDVGLSFLMVRGV